MPLGKVNQIFTNKPNALSFFPDFSHEMVVPQLFRGQSSTII